MFHSLKSFARAPLHLLGEHPPRHYLGVFARLDVQASDNFGIAEKCHGNRLRVRKRFLGAQLRYVPPQS
jgi:hypothetical protein